jgi:uncharacterized protein involved in exopolysaccharide biosynthesis
MRIVKTSFLSIVILFSTFYIDAQSVSKTVVVKSAATIVKASPAYAELLLRKTERESELEEFAIDYTEEYPKVKEIKYELSLITKEMDKLLAVSAADAGKLTLALGKLMVRKTELETDLWNLSRQYNADHLEVKRAKRKVAAYEKAIREILP